MVARGRKVVSGMVTGSLPVRSTHKVPYDRVKVMLELGVATVLLVLASPIILLCLDEITLSKAIDAIRKQDFDQGIALARQVFPETSTNPSDHLTLGRFYVAAGRSDEAGKEFRRAVELGPGVPDSWLTHVQYLVQAKQIDQAKTAIEAARQALPADRATLTLAQCWMSLGDLKRAEELVGKALNDEGKSTDPIALKVAASVALGQNRLDKVDAYLNKVDQVTNRSSSDKAWVNRIRFALLLNKGRPAGQDQALGLVEQNLKNDPNGIEDQRLKATVLALRPSRRDEAVKILEQLGGANLLDANDRFLLAQLYLGQREEQKYQDEMFRLLNLKVRSPQHLAHFVNYWIDRNQLDQADRWLAELKKAEPQGGRRGDGDPQESLVNLPPRTGRRRLFLALRRPLGGRDSETPGGSLGGPGRAEAGRFGLAHSQTGGNLDPPRSV